MKDVSGLSPWSVLAIWERISDRYHRDRGVRPTGVNPVSAVLLAVAFFESLAVLYLRWGMPLATEHAFRETQTAFTVWSMVHGDPWLAYQTPVMGPPWTIPFEFPTFQWVVAGVVYVTGLSLDNGGRLVSWAFMVASLLPLRRIALKHDVDPFVAASLMLASPLFLFWGTAFLIETCSLFLCLMFLWMVEERKWVFACGFGILAAVTKLPTAVPFIGLALMVSSFEWRCVAVVALALIAGVAWNHYTDLLKAQNPLSAVLMSNQPRQSLHNFGTMAQRLSWEPWRTLCESVKSLL